MLTKWFHQKQYHAEHRNQTLTILLKAMPFNLYAKQKLASNVSNIKCTQTNMVFLLSQPLASIFL